MRAVMRTQQKPSRCRPSAVPGFVRLGDLAPQLQPDRRAARRLARRCLLPVQGLVGAGLGGRAGALDRRRGDLVQADRDREQLRDTRRRPRHRLAQRTGSDIGGGLPDVAVDPRNGTLYVVFEDNRFSGGAHNDIAKTSAGKPYSARRMRYRAATVTSPSRTGTTTTTGS